MYSTQKAEDQDNSEEKGNEQKDPRYIIDAGKHTETKRERGASKTNNIAPSTSSSIVGACQEYIEKADLLPPYKKLMEQTSLISAIIFVFFLLPTM
jgi:hypothetical protein